MIAIVIPYYKKKYFKKTLESLAKQTNKRFNVYIGNDNSLENPDNLIKKYSQRINLKYFKFENNLGSISLVDHWNRCINLVKDEKWIIILGDDDVYEENVVEEFYKNLNEIQNLYIRVVRFSSIKIDRFDNEISKLYTHKRVETSLDSFFRKTRSSLSEYVFHKETLKSVGFQSFPLGWHSDRLAVIEISNFSYVFSINNAVVKIRISKDSISGNKNLYKKKLTASFKFYYYLINNYSNKINNEQLFELTYRLNKTYLNNKIKISRFLSIINLYIKKRKFYSLIHFMVQISRNILNKLLNA